MHPSDLVIEITRDSSVSGLLLVPEQPRAVFVFAHGAGAGMTHSFMSVVASGLHHSGIATLRYQFPFMETGSRRPDVPKVAHAAVRAALREAALQLPGVPLFAGGKSFGGRMTSQAAALHPIDGLRGIAFVGFPLHPAGKPSIDRAEHLARVALPMLFLQGTRDELAELDLIVAVTGTLANAQLEIFDDADHAFHVRKRSGQTDETVMAAIVRSLTDWMAKVSAAAA